MQPNLENLAELWRHAANDYVETESYCIARTVDSDWPNRIWFKVPLTERLLEEIAYDYATGPSLKLSVFGNRDIDTAGRLINSKPSRQLCMDLPLANFTPLLAADLLTVYIVDSQDLADRWAAVFQASFGYRITTDQILALTGNTVFFLGTHEGRDVTTGCLHFSHGGRVAGMHSVGVPAQHRRKGLAGSQVQYILEYSRANGANLSTLQASVLGEGIYRRLGYEAAERSAMATFKLD